KAVSLKLWTPCARGSRSPSPSVAKKKPSQSFLQCQPKGQAVRWDCWPARRVSRLLMTGKSTSRSFWELDAASGHLCFPLPGPCASTAEHARKTSPTGRHRRGLRQRCLFLGNEPEAGARETFPGGRDHRRVGGCCSSSPL